MTIQIVIEDAPREAALTAVKQRLIDHEPRNYQALTLLAPDELGEIMGGLVGETVWGWLQVKELWVAAGSRGRGYGKRLLQAAEREAMHEESARIGRRLVRTRRS